MVNTEELREAMYAVKHGGWIHVRDAETLAAAVRELYEALEIAQDNDRAFVKHMEEVADRYRAALEGTSNV